MASPSGAGPLVCPECGKAFAWTDGNPHYKRARHIESEHLDGEKWSPEPDDPFNTKHRNHFQREADEFFARHRARQQRESHQLFRHREHADTRTTEQKLEAVIDPKSGATEGERRNAEHLLFKRRQARESKA